MKIKLKDLLKLMPTGEYVCIHLWGDKTISGTAVVMLNCLNEMTLETEVYKITTSEDVEINITLYDDEDEEVNEE